MKKEVKRSPAVRFTGAVLAVFSLLVLFGCAGCLFRYWQDYDDSVGRTRELEERYVDRDTESVLPGTGAERNHAPKEDVPQTGAGGTYRPPAVDWEGLQTETDHVVAWLEIPGLSISYPVLQGEDNDYYLHHDPDGGESGYGSIFLSCENAGDFSDSHSIVFGHNMLDGSMFRRLNDYGDPAVFQKAPEIYVYTKEGKTRCYRIFSVYQSPLGDVSFQYGNALGSDAYREQLSSIRELSEYDTGTEISAYRPCITLKTCNTRLDYSTRTSVSAILQWELDENEQKNGSGRDPG